MKLGSTFALAVSAVSADCPAGKAALTITCNPDLVLQIDVDSDCMKEYWPDVSMSDIRLMPAEHNSVSPSDQCAPCSDEGPCSTDTNFFANHEMTSPVTESSTSIFFKATKCGAEMESAADSEFIYFRSVIGTNFGIDPDSTILTGSQMSGIQFSCKYNAIIDGVSPKFGALAVESPDAVGFVNADNSGTIDSSNVALDITATKANDHVLLGTDTTINISAIGSLTSEFYILGCTAHNSDQSKTLPIISDGCVRNYNGVLSDIGTTLSGTSFTFNQFAFTETTSALNNLHYLESADGNYIVHFTDSNMNYYEAKDYCDSVGMNMAVPTDLDSFNAIQDLVRDGYWWLGISDSAQEGTWVNVNDGTPINYVNWQQGEPNNYCGGENVAVSSSTSRQWIDIQESFDSAFAVCASPATEADSSSSIKSVGNSKLELEFGMTCQLKLGDAPSCNGRRRRNDPEPSAEVEIYLKIVSEGEVDDTDGIVTARGRDRSSAVTVAGSSALAILALHMGL